MRLYDRILASPGTLVDQTYFGSYTNMAKVMKGAQCFLIGPDLANACEEVCLSRPSSIFSALTQTRLPYPLMWLEWTPAHRTVLAQENDKPKPERMGCLLRSNKEGNKGIAIYFWQHNVNDSQFKAYDKNILPRDEYTNITLDPFGVIFDWSGSEEPVMAQFAKSIGVEIAEKTWRSKYTGSGRDAYRNSLKASRRWNRLAGFEKEVDAYIDLERTAGIVPVDECRPMFESPFGKALLPGGMMYDNFMDDLSGEFAYTQALILMLNTQNSVIQRTKEDHTRLNKARAKNRKPPLTEFTITELKLNKVHDKTAQAAGLSREAARRHMVRGHFKVRNSGVYWWSAHVRGMGELVKREEYHVDL